MTLDERLAELGRLKRAMKAAEKAASDAKEAYKQYEWDTVQVMVDRKVPSLRIEGDGLYVRKSTTFGHVNDEEAFVEWLRETEQDDEFLERPKAKKRLLNELVRDLTERGIPEDQWPPGLTTYTRDYVSLQEG